MRRWASVTPRPPSWLASGLVFDSTRPKRDQNETKTRPKRDQNARCNIANASWVSRFGMLEARVLLAFRVISLAFSQNANPTHSVIRTLVNNGHRAIKVHVNRVQYCRAGHQFYTFFFF